MYVFTKSGFLFSVVSKELHCYLFFWPHNMWDLSSPTRDRTRPPAVEVQGLNYWTAREIPALLS